MRTLSIFIMAALLMSTGLPASAGDREDLEARVIKYHQVWNQKKVDEFLTYFSSTGTSIAAADDGLFSDSVPLDRAGLDSTWRNPKVQFNQTPRYIRVDIHGNGAVGVVHYYRQGSVTDADGVITPISVRVTDVWVKEQGVWRAVHRHVSPLRLGQSGS
jgi:ketosteroid isomerase-like protein